MMTEAEAMALYPFNDSYSSFAWYAQFIQTVMYDMPGGVYNPDIPIDKPITTYTGPPKPRVVVYGGGPPMANLPYQPVNGIDDGGAPPPDLDGFYERLLPTVPVVRTAAAVTGDPDPGDGGGQTAIVGTILSIAKMLGIILNKTALVRVLALVMTGVGIATAIRQVTGGGGGGGGGNGRQPIELQGPGVPEPRPGTYRKTWRTSFEQSGTFQNGYVWFWLMNDGRVLYYSSTGKSGSYRPKKPVAVIMSGGATRLNQAVKAQRHLDKLWRTVAKRTKQLKLA